MEMRRWRCEDGDAKMEMRRWRCEDGDKAMERVSEGAMGREGRWGEIRSQSCRCKVSRR
jgi:hypothetical protein